MSSTTSSSQTESSSTISSTPTTPTSLPHIQHLITIKLNRDNYLLWKAQIVPYLQGQHLYGFIDETKPAPPSSVAAHTSDTAAVPNPEFYTWHTQDQMILSALISSLSLKPCLPMWSNAPHPVLSGSALNACSHLNPEPVACKSITSSRL
jgi:hypothetical protein